MTNYTFRLVKEEDIPELLNIYRPYVKDTAITFEIQSPSIVEYASRVKSIAAEYPYIVCMSDNKIVGYAYAHRHMERAAYQWNAELSVYIDESYHHCKIGKKLYKMIIEILKLQNVKNVYGGVSLPNEKSERLHKSFGFIKLGTYHNTGYKLGAWHDVTWYEKKIGIYDLEPTPFISIQELEINTITNILRSHAF